MTAIISLKGVVKRYRRGTQAIEVLHALDLEVEKGDFVALMGPSGSGKTTVLNLVGGLDHPSDGAISVFGERIDQLSNNRLAAWRASHIGFVFQFYNLLPMLTAERNVEVPLLLTALSRKQRMRNVGLALGIVGLTDRVKHKPAELSGGQQQRVAIARALVADPALLLCDEPTGDLDRHSADEILSLLTILNHEHHKTIIMVTHDPQAAAYATRKVVMDKGRLA